MQQACAGETAFKVQIIYKSRKNEFSEYMMMNYWGIFQIYGGSKRETGFFLWISNPPIDFLIKSATIFIILHNLLSSKLYIS